MNTRLAIPALLLCGMLMSAPAARAETYATCAGFIDSVPTTISTQGVYCLRKDVSTAQATGAAITINTNNVTIDCNDFKIGGLAAGNASIAAGIFAEDRRNIGVRHCGVRGFSAGIRLDGNGGGHLVEDNRLDGNLAVGIYVTGEHNRVRRNSVSATGGSATGNSATGIYAHGDVVDNIVDGVFAESSEYLTGISVHDDGSQVAGNRVTGIVATVKGYGIWMRGHDQTASGNHVVSGGDSAVPGAGILAEFAGDFCTGNTVVGFVLSMPSCIDAGGNGAH